jgi:predicted dehydrogenase
MWCVSGRREGVVDGVAANFARSRHRALGWSSRRAADGRRRHVRSPEAIRGRDSPLRHERPGFAGGVTLDGSSTAGVNGQPHTVKPLGREPDKSIRVGLIGYGFWGVNHCRVLAGIAGVDVTVIENRPDRLREATSTVPAVNAASSLDDVQDLLDAVVIATPSSSHSPIALKALRAGLHTMIEKPMTTTVADAEALVQTADAGGLTLMAGHTFEYHAAVWQLKQIIRSGELGRILHIDTARLQSGPGPREDCNVIWDLAPHDISIASYLLDEFPDTVSVSAEHNLGEHADVAYLRMDFTRAAAQAFAHVRWLSPDKVRRVTVVGDRKIAIFNDLAENERVRIFDAGVDPAEIDERAWNAMPVLAGSGEIISPEVQFVEPLLAQDAHFIDCVRSGCRPNTPGERGLGVVRVLAATDEAIANGAPVSTQPTLGHSIPTTVAGAQAAS